MVVIHYSNSPDYDVVPFSGGSSLEGNFAAPFGGMSIDFTHMNKIIDFHPQEWVIYMALPPVELSLNLIRGSMDIVVQPAVSWMDLNEDIKASGLFFPVDPGPSVCAFFGTSYFFG